MFKEYILPLLLAKGELFYLILRFNVRNLSTLTEAAALGPVFQEFRSGTQLTLSFSDLSGLK